MSRLAKGQTAPSVMERATRTKASVLRRFEMLRSKAESCATISTLSGLAEWDDPCNGIRPVSVNSIRKYAMDAYPGGLRGLLNRLGESREVGKVGDRPQNNRAGSTDLDLERMAESILRWADRYGDLVDRVRNLAAVDDAVRRELAAHRKRHEWPKPTLRVVGK